MCDYSLEMYRSRAAAAGDKLVTHRFPSGSMGFVEQDGDKACATCIVNDTVLRLEITDPLHAAFRARHDLNEINAVTFIRLSTGIYRDGIRLENGMEFSLQQLPSGLRAEVAALPEIKPLPEFHIPQIA